MKSTFDPKWNKPVMASYSLLPITTKSSEQNSRSNYLKALKSK